MIDSSNIKDMVNHWLATPVNGYFGQSYGSTVREQLLKNLSSFSADRFLEKLKQDIPILLKFNSDELGIYTESDGIETISVYIKISSIIIDVGNTSNPSIDTTKDFYDVAAR